MSWRKQTPEVRLHTWWWLTVFIWFSVVLNIGIDLYQGWSGHGWKRAHLLPFNIGLAAVITVVWFAQRSLLQRRSARAGHAGSHVTQEPTPP